MEDGVTRIVNVQVTATLWCARLWACWMWVCRWHRIEIVRRSDHTGYAIYGHGRKE